MHCFSFLVWLKRKILKYFNFFARILTTFSLPGIFRKQEVFQQRLMISRVNISSIWDDICVWSAVFSTYRTKHNFKFSPTSHKILSISFLLITCMKKKLKNLCYRPVVISSYCPFMGSLQQEVIFNGTTKLLCNCTIYMHIAWEKKMSRNFDDGDGEPSIPEGTFFRLLLKSWGAILKGNNKENKL